jgi:glycosyltransferase involved in cell wall biosynthesis
MSIIEAMHSGLPVIGSDLPGIAELVDETNGWLIPAKQPGKLEEELHKIINAKDSYRQKGLISKNKVMRLCSFENFISGYKSIYAGEEI